MNSMPHRAISRDVDCAYTGHYGSDSVRRLGGASYLGYSVYYAASSNRKVVLCGAVPLSMGYIDTNWMN